MKKIIVLLLILTAITAAATDNQRIVKEIPQPFDRVVANGDITVEIVFDPEHKGYMVYHSTDTLLPQIECINDSSTLIVSGLVNHTGTSSRVVIVACDSIVSVINNSTSPLLIKKIPRVATLDLVINGSGDIKTGTLQAHHLQLISNSSGNILIDNLSARFAEIISTSTGNITVDNMKSHGSKVISAGDGNITIPHLITRRAIFSANATGSITIGGKAKAAALTTCGSGSINAVKMKIKRLTTATHGTGKIILNKPE